ncbi:hypothetical protein [Verrucomicrobium sp. 3C]|uniref:hypothetical protein n=1 Tax=Verrucomicrobium sp. 3C TaxID=1134055 RepID=UPI00035C89F7|nr:hypothetical protein [Verrucomicrobium sp. 3C]
MQKKWLGWGRILGVLLGLTWGLQPRISWAHGGGGLGDLGCGMLQQGGYAIHMDVYVYSYGGTGGFKSYCQNVPTTGKMSLVLDLVTPQLRKIPIECKVFSSSGNLVSHFQPQVYSSGVASLDLNLPDRGRYLVELALVGKTGADGKPLVFRFPITIGMGMIWMVVAAAGLLVVGGAGAYAYQRIARGQRPTAGPREIKASAP